MSAQFEIPIAIALAIAGVLIGHLCSRLPRSWWLVGFAPPFLLILTLTLSARWPDLTLSPTLSWLFAGRWRFVAMGFVATLLLTTPLSRLPRRNDRFAVGVLMVLLVFQMSLWPCLAAAVDRDRLAALPTRFDHDGICRQSTEYTCGPAAAVTALKRFSISATESDLALAARTSIATGTPPDVLAQVLQERYGPMGLDVQLRAFRDLEELKAAPGITLVVVKFGLLIDHWLAVLEVTDREVIVANPLSGKERMSHVEFMERWRRLGVTLNRGSSPPLHLRDTGLSSLPVR